MNNKIYNQLEIREIFHLEFMRNFSKKFRPRNYALKGGCNLRFFFDSFRYSEDMDIDIDGVSVDLLKERVMAILGSAFFSDTMQTFSVQQIIPPDIHSAKQTRTTQRFKVHLITFSGENLFTKIEFSRRGIKDKAAIDTISRSLLRKYKTAPFIISHYTSEAAAAQKIKALAFRKIPQARDIFDIYLLMPQSGEEKIKEIASRTAKKAADNIYGISYDEFRGQVISYLAPDLQKTYDSPDIWEEIQLMAAKYIETSGRRKNGK